MAKTEPTKPDTPSGTLPKDAATPSAPTIPPPPTAGPEAKPPEPKPPVAGEKGQTPTPPAPQKGNVKSDPPKGGKSDKSPNPTKKPAPKKPPTPKKGAQDKGDKPPEKTAEKSEPPEPEPEVASTKALFSGKAKKFVHLDSSELHDFHTFRKHPYQVKDNAEMFALVEKVKRGGVREPVLVRPQPEGGYEILSGHRRRRANDLAEGGKLPCIVVEMND